MSIMTEAQLNDLASAIADQLWSFCPELLNTSESKNYYLLEAAITDIIEGERKLNKIAQPDTSQGYNIFGTPKTLRLLSEVKS